MKAISQQVFNLSASLVSAEGVYSGKIVIKSKNSQFKVTVPYRARVLSGSLLLDEECTHFFLPDVDNNGRGTAGVAAREAKRERGKLEREISVENNFSVPVVVHRVTMGKGSGGGSSGKKESKYFHLHQLGPVILSPGEKVPVVKLVLRPGAWDDRTLDSILTLHTNLSSVVVPLLVFHGRMDTVSFQTKYICMHCKISNHARIFSSCPDLPAKICYHSERWAWRSGGTSTSP